MYNKKIVNLKNLLAVNEIIKRLNRLPRWTSMDNKPPYNDLNKQSLDFNIACLLAKYAEVHGKTIIWENFPKVAIYRIFQKGYIFFDTRRETIEAVLEVGGISKSVIEEKTIEIIKEHTNEEFGNFIFEVLNSYEMRIAKASRRIANLVELMELSLSNNPTVIKKKFHQIISSLEQYSDIPGVLEFSNTDGNYFDVLLQISSRRNINRFNYTEVFSDFSILRNQNRWTVQMAPVNCSVLGHEFDAAIWGYFIGLEKFGDEKIATLMWEDLLVHDQPEAYTNDMPSPFKKMIPGFRPALGKYEEQLLQINLYDKLPDFMADFIRSHMMDAPENKHLFPYLKGADYLSADSECWRQYQMGSRDTYFYKSAMLDFEDQLKKGTYILPANCRKLHDYFMKHAFACIKDFLELESELELELENEEI